MVRRFRWAVGAALAVVVATTGGAAAGGKYDEPELHVVAEGLDNPRGVLLHGGKVLVAEAGRGGDGPCLPAPGGDGEMCLGATSAVTEVKPGGYQKRIVTGLPSLAGEDGAFAIGLHDLVAGPGGLRGVIGLENNPARRAELGSGGALLAHLVRLVPGDGAEPIADLGAFEASENPVNDPDTNPYGLLAAGKGNILVDAGGNDLLAVDKRGRIRLLTTFPDVPVPAPDFLDLPPGTEIPLQAVPTTVVRGPDGALYVGQLTGFPFPPGGAKVWRVVPGKAPTVYADGFTNIIDIAFDKKGRLWVLEISKNGLASEDLTGALIRVDRNGKQTELVPGELTAPGGLAIAKDGSLYVTDNSVFPGAGRLLHIVP